MAEDADASALAALSIEVWLGTYLRNGINAVFADYVLSEFTAEKFRNLIADDSHRITVSQNSDGIDGFIRVTKGPRPPEGPVSRVEISTLYVQPRHHGCGLGAVLLNQGLQIARNWGEPAPWLTTNWENHAAIGFYQHQGFEITGRTYFTVDDQAYPNEILMYQPDRSAG